MLYICAHIYAGSKEPHFFRSNSILECDSVHVMVLADPDAGRYE